MPQETKEGEELQAILAGRQKAVPADPGQVLVESYAVCERTNQTV